MSYVRNCWYVIGWSHDYEVGKLHAVSVVNEPLAVYRKPDGGLVVMEDRCCHRMAPLSAGQIEGDTVRCMYHGMRFAADGKCVEIPGQDLIPNDFRVQTYPVVDRHSWVWVWMGDPARADERLIPESVPLDSPDWLLGWDQLEMNANYMLVLDNLLDLTHLAYVHRAPNSLGAGNMSWATTRPRITRLDRGIHSVRWMPGVRMSPYQRGIGLPTDAYEFIDRLSVYDLLIPGIFLMRTNYYPPGVAEACGFDASPDVEPLHKSCTCHAVLATSDNHTRYWYNFGPEKRHGSMALVKEMIATANRAFAEDRAIIEAQSKVLERSEGRRMRVTNMDGGISSFRFVMDRLLAAEAAPARAEAGE